MEGITSVLDLINTYSSTLILAAIAIYLGYKVVSNQIQKSRNEDDLNFQIRKSRVSKDQEREDLLQKQLERMYETVLTAWDRKMLEDTNKQLSDDLHTDKIEKLLSKLVDGCSAERASLFMYHNGGHDMTGRSFQKMSCTNQRVKVGIASTQNAYQNMYKASLHYITKSVKSTRYCYIDDLKDIKEEDYSTYDILTQNGCRRLYARAIRNIDGTTIGFLAITSGTPINPKVDNCDDCKQLLDHVASNVEGIIATRSDNGGRK